MVLSAGGDGAEIIYALRNNDVLSRDIANEFIKSGQNVRKYYQRRLPSDPSKDYYYIIRDTPDNQTIIVEYGFADSTGDDPNLIKNNWQELAEAVVRGVTTYLGVTYVPISGEITYTVKSGDTLWSIAKKYGVSVADIKTKNNLTTNSLSINQILLIPTEKPTEDTYYTVVSGDSLYSISKKYNLTVDELKSLNNLTSNTLSIGQKLLVSKVSTTPSTTEDNYYTVVSGDNLYFIAKKYNLTVDELKTLNNLTSNTLSIGQKLLVKQSTTSTTPITPTDTSNTYTVKSGDNLYKLAKDFNTTVNDLKTLNNLVSEVLSIGQVLKIPTTTTKTYTVQSGDNLYSIARKFNTTVSVLKDINNLVSEVLSIGQKLLLP